MQHFNRIIIGATTTGLGAFFSEPENSLLIEPSSMIGPDFASCFFTGTSSGNILEGDKSHPLFHEAYKIGVLKEGLVHLPGLQTLMYKYLVPHAKNCLFLTEYLGSELNEEKITVTIFNKNGTTTYSCDELIDATALMITNQIKTEIKSVTLGSAFVSLKEDAIIPKLNIGEITQTCFPNEFYFHLPISVQDSWGKARSDFIAFIAEHKNDFEGWALAATAVEKNVKVSTTYKGLANVLNPSFYDGIVNGFTAGLNYFENRKALV